VCFGWTDRYVTSTAVGGGDGLTESTAWTIAEAIAGVQAGYRVNIKAGTYASGATSLTFAVAGTTDALIWWRGYNTVAGDLDTNKSWSLAMPVFTFTTGQFYASASYNKFTFLTDSGATTTTGGQFRLSVSNVTVDRCRIICVGTSSTNSAAITMNSASYLLGSYVRADNAAINAVSGNGLIAGCYIEGGKFNVRSGSDLTITKSVLNNADSSGFQQTSATGKIIIDNSIIHSPRYDGIMQDIALTTGYIYIINTVIDSCGRYAISKLATPATSNIRAINCGFWANAGGDFNNITEIIDVSSDLSKSLGNAVESNDPYISAVTKDFRLKATSLFNGSGLPFMLKTN